MTRRIGIVGGEGTGKSSLARALADTLPACLVEEALRAFVQREGRPPDQAEQPALLAAQQSAEDAAAAACPHGVVVTDPAPLMTAVYSLLYFADDSLVRPAVERCRDYDLLVWCAPDVPWAADPGQRDGPEHRAAADEILRRIVVDELRPRGVAALRVTGSLPDRLGAVRRAWQPVGP